MCTPLLFFYLVGRGGSATKNKTQDGLTEVQLLGSLEIFQISLAKLRVIAKDHEEVIQSDYMSLFKVTAVASGAGDSICKLEDACKSFQTLVSQCSPLSAKLTETYGFQAMKDKVQALTTAEVNNIVKQWGENLVKAEAKLTGALPLEWEKNALNSCDEDFVKNQIMSSKTMTAISGSHSHVHTFIKNLSKHYPMLVGKLEERPVCSNNARRVTFSIAPSELNVITTKQKGTKQKEQHGGIMRGVDKACLNSKVVLAMALAYHTYFVKMPLAKDKQAKKDFIKALKDKLKDKRLVCPDVVLARISS